MPIINPTVTPLGVLSLAINAVFAPLTAWLVRNAAKVLKKYNVLDSKYRDARKDIDELKRSCTESDRRLIRLEEGIAEIGRSIARAEGQFNAISVELKQLPRLIALMEAQAAAATQIVPRDEVKLALDQHDQRLKLVEQDIRNASKER